MFFLILVIDDTAMFTVQPQQPAAPRARDHVYSVPSGKRTGIRETWFVDQLIKLVSDDLAQLICRPDAGDATQGIPGGTVRRIQVAVPRQRKGRRAA
jgi:hypothetical protein